MNSISNIDELVEFVNSEKEYLIKEFVELNSEDNKRIVALSSQIQSFSLEYEKLKELYIELLDSVSLKKGLRVLFSEEVSKRDLFAQILQGETNTQKPEFDEELLKKEIEDLSREATSLESLLVPSIKDYESVETLWTEINRLEPREAELREAVKQTEKEIQRLDSEIEKYHFVGEKTQDSSKDTKSGLGQVRKPVVEGSKLQMFSEKKPLEKSLDPVSNEGEGQSGSFTQTGKPGDVAPVIEGGISGEIQVQIVEGSKAGGWNKRWVDVSGGNLSLLKKEGDKPLNVYKLSGARISKKEKDSIKKGMYSFELVFGDAKTTLNFLSKNVKEQSDWVKGIKKFT